MAQSRILLLKALNFPPPLFLLNKGVVFFLFSMQCRVKEEISIGSRMVKEKNGGGYECSECKTGDYSAIFLSSKNMLHLVCPIILYFDKSNIFHICPLIDPRFCISNATLQQIYYFHIFVKL